MKINVENTEKPLFIMVAEAIEDNILTGVFKEEEQIISTIQIAIINNINPATANKGVNMLVDQGVLYKKRGVGMFVSAGAKQLIKLKRTGEFYQKFVVTFCQEASALQISKENIMKMIDDYYRNGEEK